MVTFEDVPGATPLDDEELAGLIPDHVTTRAQLNELEQANIISAQAWINQARIKSVTDREFLLRLHKQMFGSVWQWAGKFRLTEKNIGVAPNQISVGLLNLCHDAETWIEYKTYPLDEIAARFHHRLVAIHLFSNGNGRHARMAADLLLERTLGRPPFTWGSTTLVESGETRTKYINALKSADKNDYEPLLRFVRT